MERTGRVRRECRVRLPPPHLGGGARAPVLQAAVAVEAQPLRRVPRAPVRAVRWAGAGGAVWRALERAQELAREQERVTAQRAAVLDGVQVAASRTLAVGAAAWSWAAVVWR